MTDAPTPPPADLCWADAFALQQLYADYASIVDRADWDAWVACFTEDALYRVQPRENHERGFPLATLSLRGHGMLKDRVYGIRETLFHDPYYQRHVVGLPRLRALDADRCEGEANYAVFRTKLSEPSTVYNVGRYLDLIVRTPDGWRLARRECIYDTELIPNSLIYPI